MRDEDLRQKVNRVNAQKESFTVSAPQGKGKLVKRLGRKMTFWYVNPFGQAQNEFNTAAADAMTELQHNMDAVKAQLAALSEQIDRRCSALAQEQRQALLHSRSVQQEALQTLEDTMNEAFAAAAPESRPQAGCAPLTELPRFSGETLFQELQAVQNASGEEQTQQALSALETRYASVLQTTLQECSDAAFHRPIMLVCRSFSSGNGMDAIRNEMWDLYRLLKTASRYPAQILSIESEGNCIQQQGDVYYVPDALLPEWIKQHKPALLIFCESTSGILHAGKDCMLMYNSILRLSGQNPAQKLGGSQMQELLHLCDYGVHHYCTASQTAADTMQKLGFRRPAVIYPYIDTKKPMFSRRPRVFQKERFTVGFASSPMLEEQAQSRGIPALCETVRLCPEVQFIVLWRDPDGAAVPQSLLNAANCTVLYGKQDMTEFYSSIDCVLIPYADHNYNHACSLSALEGMLMDLPVAATPAAGIAELICQTGLGVVSEDCSAQALTKALHTIRDSYAGFANAWRTERLKDLVSGHSFVHYAEECAKHPAPFGVITIFEWDRQLKLENRHLIKGHAALKAYYQRQDVAIDYTKTRFSAYPQNCFDLMERQSVAVLLAHQLQNRTDCRLLDLACGDGRILQMLLPFGDCTAGDASPAMLELVKRRFPTASLHTMQIDLLDHAISGQYDVITIFRFIRHYEYASRQLLWNKLKAALTPAGLLLFDVPNLRFEVPHRQRTGWGKYHVYDVFWTKETLQKELADHGLALEALIPIGQGLYPMPSAFRNEPMTWTAAVRIAPETP